MSIPTLGIFDLETTGVDPETDRIVTAFVGVLDELGNVISGQGWMIRPDGYVIPDNAAAVHGVTTEQALAEGRPFAEVLPEIVTALVALDVPVVAHNASYDFTMLAHEMDRFGATDPVAIIDDLDIVDTYVLDKQFDKWRRGSRTLTAIAPLYGVTLTEEEAHGAQADAIAAGRIALRILAEPLFRGVTPAGLRRPQTGWSREQRASLMAYKREHGEPEFTIDLNWPLYASALALSVPEEVYTF